MKPGKLLSFLFCALILSVSPVFAYDLTLSPLGDGRFSVSGTAMKGVGGIRLVIEYDSSILTEPIVSQGRMFSGINAMMSANTNNPGNITVAILNNAGFNGSGQLLTIGFIGKKGIGGINNMRITTTIDTNYAPLSANTIIIPEALPGGSSQPPDTSDYPPDRQSTTQTPPPTSPAPLTPAAATPSIGSITLPGDNMQPDTQKRQEQAAAAPLAEQYRQTAQPAAKTEESRQPEAKPKKIEEIKRVGYVSILERFRAYRGDRKPLILAELFSKPIDSNISQEPAIIAADGMAKTTLKVLLDLKEDDSAPNFAAADAKISSLRSDEATGRWIIELLPAKGALTASLSILAGSRLMDIPLVTVPLIKTLNFSEKEMAAFVKDFGAEKPVFDLNNDGRHDYIDDYIYAGNLLLAGRKTGAGK